MCIIVTEGISSCKINFLSLLCGIFFFLLHLLHLFLSLNAGDDRLMFNFIITGEKFNNCQTYIMQNPNTSIIDY